MAVSRSFLVGAALLASLALGVGVARPAPAAAQSDSLPSWVAVAAAERTVTLALDVQPGTAGAMLNGEREGSVQVVVPVGWTVRWTWVNHDSAAAHSLVVMAEREKLPEVGGRPAFTNAMTRMVTAGLPAGRTDETTFEADAPGWYWLLCGVATHALRGEWIGLRVDPSASAVSVRRKGS